MYGHKYTVVTFCYQHQTRIFVCRGVHRRVQISQNRDRGRGGSKTRVVARVLRRLVVRALSPRMRIVTGALQRALPAINQSINHQACHNVIAHTFEAINE